MDSENRFENGFGIAHGDTDARGHHKRQIQKGAPPILGAQDALGDEIETRNRASGGEEEREIDDQHLKPALVEAHDHGR